MGTLGADGLNLVAGNAVDLYHLAHPLLVGDEGDRRQVADSDLRRGPPGAQQQRGGGPGRACDADELGLVRVELRVPGHHDHVR
jgi:hypothetical protein